MVEVFCTNIQESTVASKILNEIEEKFPGLKANFDLEDCDKILRIESKKNVCKKVINLLKLYHFDCIELL